MKKSNTFSFLRLSTLVLLCFFITSAIISQQPDSLKNISLSGLTFRSIGPSITGGRIVDIAVNPKDNNEYYAASGHGNLWKTTNNGITFTPTFDNQNSYAIGAVEIDPSNPNIVWVGTGENNNQNNVIYGDGVYKSEDGGKSWKNMGLKNSEHIGAIVIDPENSNVVYVAAYGPLRRGGGDRGIYKTVDGGKTWSKVLFVSEFTGFFEIHMDPSHSNILYAVAHQRMRKLYTGVSGGPESGVYRSLDSGETWEKLTNGLPSNDLGRVGLTVSPVNPDYIYAIVEAGPSDKGFYKSTDRGASWAKQSSYISSYAFYFQKIFCDTKFVDRVYSMDVFMQVTNDGGKNWSNVGSAFKHVDDHYLWIDPADNRHFIAGCDGGVYDTYDSGQSWDFKANMPIAEIYKVTTDNAVPFYNVFAGAQDNNSFSGPSRTISSGGITNQDWFFTNSGDGFETQVDWKNPNIIYAQSQNGGLVRFDKLSGENLYIKPYEYADTAYRFDWDAALLISRHDNKRLYFGGNKLLKSDDMGSTWIEISPDLTRGVPKEMQKLMGRSWSIDELARKSSMAQIVTIAESEIDENILFVGSGDGLISFTNDGGKTWSKSKIPGLPEFARISQIIASKYDKLMAYAACQNFNDGDYNPYLYKTTDGGKNWNLFNSNLPAKGSTYTIAEDHIDKNLLFVGTQFGLFFSNDAGKEWLPLKNGLPTHCVMDMEIQRRENDLVVSTFGRGIYILDDYSPLRFLNKENLQKDAFIFPVKDALMFIPSNPFGFRGTAFLGASFYSAPNPEVGAVLTYYIKIEDKSLKQKRRDLEKANLKKGDDIKHPSYEQLKSESDEQESYLLFTITDENDNVVKKIKTKAQKGVNRLVWDFRYNPFTPISLKPYDDSVPWIEPERGYMVVPGKYKVSISKYKEGKWQQIVEPQEFVCKSLGNTSLPAEDLTALDNFNKKVAELTRVVSSADAYKDELSEKLTYLKKGVLDSPNTPKEALDKLGSIELSIKKFNQDLNGDQLRAKFEGAAPTSVKERIDLITSALWNTTAAPTATFIRSYDEASAKFGAILESLKTIENDITQVEELLDKSGAQHTPGRFPVWNKN